MWTNHVGNVRGQKQIGTLKGRSYSQCESHTTLKVCPMPRSSSSSAIALRVRVRGGPREGGREGGRKGGPEGLILCGALRG